MPVFTQKPCLAQDILLKIEDLKERFPEDIFMRATNYLIHGKIVPNSLVIPVSAHMLNYRKAYDDILEKYSKPLMQRIRFSKNDHGELAITNQEDVEGFFRYPDLTDQCIYLAHVIHDTIKEEMPQELSFIQRYDEAKKVIQRIVDMPDKMINQLLIFLYQNKGG